MWGVLEGWEVWGWEVGGVLEGWEGWEVLGELAIHIATDP